MLNPDLKSAEQLRSLYNQTTHDFIKIAKAKLAAAFGAKHIIASDDFFKKGFDRACDNQIVTLVIECLLHCRNRPLEILEVASGSTYSQYSSIGHFFHYGSPWLSRKLKYAFGGLLNIRISDYEPDPLLSESASKIFVFFFRTRELNLYIACEKVITDKAWLLPHYFTELAPITANNLCSLPPEMISVCNKIVSDFKKFSQSEGELFVRMLTDKKAEQEAFGIEFISQTDYLNLSATFPKDKFDIIFGRHLNPLPKETANIRKKLKLFDLSAKSVLSMNGSAILHFHNDIDSTNYLHLIRNVNLIR